MTAWNWSDIARSISVKEHEMNLVTLNLKLYLPGHRRMQINLQLLESLDNCGQITKLQRIWLQKFGKDHN